MTTEEKIVDLLAEGVSTLAQLTAALAADGFGTGETEKILSDLTEADFVEVTNLNGLRVRREGDRILEFGNAVLALTPAGVKRWMLEDAKRSADC